MTDLPTEDRDEQVRYLSKQLAIPPLEADRLLENMVSDS